jgi:hypothetical protein
MRAIGLVIDSADAIASPSPTIIPTASNRCDASIWKHLVEPSVVVGDLLEAFHRVGELQIHFHFRLDRPLGLFLGTWGAPIPEDKDEPRRR